MSYLPTAQEWEGVVQTEIREEVGAEENTINVTAMHGVETTSRDYFHCVFSYKNYGHQMKRGGDRLKAINNKMKWICIEQVIESLGFA